VYVRGLRLVAGTSLLEFFVVTTTNMLPLLYGASSLYVETFDYPNHHIVSLFWLLFDCSLFPQIGWEGSLPMVLLDLMRYSECQPLVTSAFKLLTMHFSRMKTVLSSLSQVVLLPTEESVKVITTL
jgi:hypothetical protein